MNEMVDSVRIRQLLNESIQRCKTREYPNTNVIFKGLLAIFDAKIKKELALIRQKTVKPLLDTVLTEQEIDDTKGS